MELGIKHIVILYATTGSTAQCYHFMIIRNHPINDLPCQTTAIANHIFITYTLFVY